MRFTVPLKLILAIYLLLQSNFLPAATHEAQQLLAFTAESCRNWEMRPKPAQTSKTRN